MCLAQLLPRALCLRGRKWHEKAQRLYFEYFYARALLVLNVGVLFCCIAPVVSLFVLLWLLLVLPVWAHNLGKSYTPPQGAGFDSGGVFWLSAVRQPDLG